MGIILPGRVIQESQSLEAVKAAQAQEQITETRNDIYCIWTEDALQGTLDVF